MLRSLILALLVMLVAGSATAQPIGWITQAGPNAGKGSGGSVAPTSCPYSVDNGCAASTTTVIPDAAVIDRNFALDTASSGQLPASPTGAQIAQRNAWLHNAGYNVPGVDYAVGSEDPSSGKLVPISLFPCTRSQLDLGTCTSIGTDGVCTYLASGFATSGYLGNGPYLKCTGLGPSGVEKVQGYDFSNTTATLASQTGATGSGAAGVQITGTNDPTSEYDFYNDYFQNNLEQAQPFTASQAGGLMTVTSGTVQLVPGQPVYGPGVPAGETVTGEYGTAYTFSNNQTLGSAGSPVAMTCGGTNFSGYLTGSSLYVTSGSVTLPPGCTLSGGGVSCSGQAGGVGGCPIVEEYQSTAWTVSSTATVASNPGWNSPQNDVWQTAHAAGGVGAYPFYVGGPPSGANQPLNVKFVNITVDGNTRGARALNILDQNFRNTADNDVREGPNLPYNWIQYITYSAVFNIGHNPMIGIGGGGVISKYSYYRGNCLVLHNLCHGEIAEFPASNTTRNLEQYIGNVFVQDAVYCGPQGYFSTSVLCASATAAMYITSGTQNNTIFNTVDMENNLVVINNIACTGPLNYTVNPFPGDGFGPNNQCNSSTQGAGDGLFAISGVTNIGTLIAKGNVLDGTGTIFAYSNGFQDALAPPIVTSPGAGTVLNKLVPEFNTLLQSGGVLGAWWPNMWLHAEQDVWPGFVDTSIASIYPTGSNTYVIGPNFVGSTGGGASTTLTTTTTVTLTAGDVLYNMVAGSVPGGYLLNSAIGTTIAASGTGTSFTLANSVNIPAGTRIIAVNAPQVASAPGTPNSGCVPTSEANCGTFTVAASEPAMPVNTITATQTAAAGQKNIIFGVGNIPAWLNSGTVSDVGYIVQDLTTPTAIPASEYIDGFHITGGQNDGIQLHYNLTDVGVQIGDNLAFYPILQIFTYIGNTGGVVSSGNWTVGGAYATRLSTGPTVVAIPPTTSSTGQGWGNVTCPSGC